MLPNQERRAARERGITFPQLVRDALTHELEMNGQALARPRCIGIIDIGGLARRREYEPGAWR